MDRRSFVLVALLPAVSLLCAPACVGDDPTVVQEGPGADATPPPSTENDGSSDTDGGSTCAVGMADCDGDPKNGCETDTRSSATHCGACGRTCGGTASCEQSECTVERLKADLDHPFSLELAGPRLLWFEPAVIRGCRADDCNTSTARIVEVTGSDPPTVAGSPRQIAVLDDKLYFSHCANGGCGAASCDVTGCKLSGATFVTTSNPFRRSRVVVGAPDAIYMFQGIDGLYRTDVTAKSITYLNSTYHVGERVQTMHADASWFIWVDDSPSLANPVGGVYACPIAGCPDAPNPLLPPPVKHLAYANGTVYSSTGGAAASTASVVACAVTGCDGAGTVLAQNQAYVTDIAVADDAVYFTTAGVEDVTTNSASVGAVMRCSLPSCPGGPTKIADGVLNPVSVRVDSKYVYWVSHGSPGTTDGAVFRRRR